MPIRSRIKKKIKKIIGISPAQQEKEERVIDPPPPKKEAVKPESPPEEMPKEAPKEAPKETSKEEPTPTAQKETPPKNKVSQEKIQRHLLRTKKGLLKFLQQEGGTTDLAALHTRSETRFLIGHQKFSELMEEMVDTDLVHYDWDNQEATITQKGIDFIAG